MSLLFFSPFPLRLESVGNCCLALPLLILPLSGLGGIINPYVALTNTEPVERKTYICGTTNPVLGHNKRTNRAVYRIFGVLLTRWTPSLCAGNWDFLGLVERTSVENKFGLQLSTKDRKLMKNVLSGIENNEGEKWCVCWWHV